MFKFRQKEKFLLLDVSREKISGLLISLDDQKKIKKEKFWGNLEKDTSSKWPPLIPSVSKTIVVCDPELAIKMFIVLSMERSGHSESIDRFELENVLAQAVSRVFNRYRREASLALGSDELNTILVDSNISEFEVDGHKIINPVGFKPREMRAIMEMTFTARETFERVKSVKKASNFFFTEKGQAQAEILRKMFNKRNGFLAVGTDRSYLYTDDGKSGSVFNRHELKWGTGKFSMEIANKWSLNEVAASNIYQYYVKENVSPNMEKHLKRMFSRPVKELSSAIPKAKTTGRIYVMGVPINVVGKNTFCEVPYEEFVSKLGFRADDASYASSMDIFRELAPFLEFYYDNSNSEINGWLKRRLHWLGSAV